jgi:SAM-dependent methyltransferase
MDSHQPVTQSEESAQAGFTKIYAEGNPPWDIGKPQPPFLTVADQVTGPVLDAGCGTGNTALFFAARGLHVTGIDFVEEAIRLARAKAAERGLSADFRVMDAMKLVDWDQRFASVIDSGLFHIYRGEARRPYVAGLRHVTRPGGRLFLFSFSDEDVRPEPGVSRQELAEAFADGWVIESLEIVRGELNPAFVAASPGEFPDGGPKMLFAILRRTE